MKFIKENSRIYSLDENKKIIAEITFQEIERGVFCIDHTFVDETLRGQGIASQLVKMAVEDIEKKNEKIKATCPYAKRWLEKNKKY